MLRLCLAYSSPAKALYYGSVLRSILEIFMRGGGNTQYVTVTELKININYFDFTGTSRKSEMSLSVLCIAFN